MTVDWHLYAEVLAFGAPYLVAALAAILIWIHVLERDSNDDDDF